MDEIIVEVRGRPEEPGFRDTVIVVREYHIVYASPMRSAPNWRTPRSDGARPWHEKYDCIAPGQYTWEFIPRHPRYGNWLVINHGGEVASRNPRPNADGSIFTEVGFHAAQNDYWPGSAGCQTLQPVFWAAFIRLFDVGDKGMLFVKDMA